MKRVMLTLGAGSGRRVDRPGGAGAAESVGHVAATESEWRAGEPVRVHDHADGRQRDDPHAAQQSRVGDAETERRGDPHPDRRRPGGAPPPRRCLAPRGKARSSW